MNKYHKKNIFTLKRDGWVWTGECLYDDDSGDFVPFGKGKMEISDLKDENRGAYRGEVIYGELHGSGTYTWAGAPYEGNKYFGEWMYGEMHGEGTHIWTDGRKYVGEWKDGEMHGQGTMTWAEGEGDKYVGEWKNGEEHGEGTYIYANGDKYVGEWKNGELHGSGTWHFEETEDCAPYTRKVEYKNGDVNVLMLNSKFNYRVPFEALVEPENYLVAPMFLQSYLMIP